MKLSTYLAQRKIRRSDFAEAVGASPFAVGKWARGDRIPRPATLLKIADVTEGQVTANDFIGSSPAQPERASA